MSYLSLLCSVLLLLTTSGAGQPEVQAVQSSPPPPPPDQPSPTPDAGIPETADAAETTMTTSPAVDVEQPKVAFKLADGGTAPKTVLLADTEAKSK